MRGGNRGGSREARGEQKAAGSERNQSNETVRREGFEGTSGERARQRGRGRRRRQTAVGHAQQLLRGRQQPRVAGRRCSSRPELSCPSAAPGPPTCRQRTRTAEGGTGRRRGTARGGAGAHRRRQRAAQAQSTRAGGKEGGKKKRGGRGSRGVPLLVVERRLVDQALELVQVCGRRRGRRRRRGVERKASRGMEEVAPDARLKRARGRARQGRVAVRPRRLVGLRGGKQRARRSASPEEVRMKRMPKTATCSSSLPKKLFCWSSRPTPAHGVGGERRGNGQRSASRVNLNSRALPKARRRKARAPRTHR